MMENIREVLDRVAHMGGRAFDRAEHFNPLNLEKIVKRIILTAGVALAIYALAKGLATFLMVGRICKAVEFIAQVALS